MLSRIWYSDNVSVEPCVQVRRGGVKSAYSSPTSYPCHLHLSTDRHPILHTPMLQMPNPPQSATPRHIRHTLYTQETVQIHTALSILQRHSTNPSHHHSLRSLQAMQILSLYRRCFSPISYVNKLWTQALYIFPLCGMMHHGLPG